METLKIYIFLKESAVLISIVLLLYNTAQELLVPVQLVAFIC